jgi:hypothetical protein
MLVFHAADTAVLADAPATFGELFALSDRVDLRQRQVHGRSPRGTYGSAPMDCMDGDMSCVL